MKNIFFSLDKKKRLLVITCFFLLCLSVLGFYLVAQGGKEGGGSLGLGVSGEGGVAEQASLPGATSTSAVLVRRKIDGMPVPAGTDNSQLLAAMIDNHPDARPAAGLARASLVYEAEAEGSITRYLAIFPGDTELDKLGPIRSARPYFVDWAREVGALYVHSGGSPEALEKLKNNEYFDFNEFYNGRYFWRDNNRPRPHNLFTSSDELSQYLKARKRKIANFEPWKFKDELPFDGRPENGGVKINFLLPDFVVHWKYDKANNDYSRYLKNTLHQDEVGETVKAKNILIEYAQARVADEKLRLDVDNIGTGKALICTDGICSKGSWRKDATGKRNRFFMEDGREAELNAGTTWVEVVRPNYDIELIK